MTNMSLDQIALPFAGEGDVVQDEGYSEDPLSRNSMVQSTMSEAEASRAQGLSNPAPQALATTSMNLDVDDRISLVIQLLRSMPAAKVQDIVNAMYPILHISFLDRLPPEVCLKILGLLDPKSLISLARTSKLAASLSSDWTLWQNLYYREGFLINQNELRKFEQELATSNERLRQTPRSRPTTSGAPPKKRSRPTPDNSRNHYQNEDSEMIDVDPAYQEQSSIFGAPSMSSGNTPRFDRDDASDKATFSPSPMSPSTFECQGSTASSKSKNFEFPPLSSCLTTLDRLTNSRRLNWQFLYTQRCRLEDNWANERYTNYQIPHPDYPEEAHTECIYTVQHDGTNLVSGSRDMSVRVWSLDTCRLIHRPLVGHKGSVLCLQFDASPSEDLIISGGSDHTVRIWRFSTGRPLQVLKNAHAESVLNLKFNSHILVTCSKDRTLKIFNRRPLHPGELGYQLPQDFVVKPVPQVINYPGLVPNPYGDLPVKPPYSLIGTLEGHGAAINACQILGNEIVSASGDRLAKVWDWPSGVCTRSLVGHTKGVACVQYDGRRIVTGSSDCEIKVFDRQTGVEVASLKGPGGHSALVRTVQAGFADVGSESEVREEDRRKAWAVDHRFFDAWSERPDHEKMKWAMDARSRYAGNAGSERPEDIICYGATLPPGGGGGRYGRIVSGSYDETIIIWRRDPAGVWKPKSVLRQADAGRSALLQFELNLPEPHSTYLVERVVKSLESQEDTSAWYRELMDALIAAGPDALRQGLTAYPILMSHSPRLLSLIRDNGGTTAGPEGTRELIQGGMVVRNRLRAIVHAALYRELQGVTYRLMRLDHDESTLREHIRVAEEAMAAAELSRQNEGWPYDEKDVIWRQRLTQHKLQEEKQVPRSKRFAECDDRLEMQGVHPMLRQRQNADAAPAIDGILPAVTQPRVANPDLEASASLSATASGPSSSTGFAGAGALRNSHIKNYLTIEAANIAKLHKQLEQFNDAKESTRTHHRLLNKMLHDVDPPVHGQAAGAGGDGQRENERGNWEGRVFKLQFDARRIVCASSNPIILVWDFANRDRDIEEASRFFKGVE